MGKKLVVSKKELAEMLGLGISTIDKLRAQGIIPCVRLNRRVLFRVEDIQKVLEKYVKRQLRNKHYGK